MNIMLVSQCTKNALIETRRILDQFAERKGSRTWQTAITRQGMLTMRKMLRQSARRNTAVACHWIKQGGYTELLWIVGNTSKFNERGTVPTNSTERNVLRAQRENQWHTLEDIALITALAGLFHDFGKANHLFQQKLKTARFSQEPYRHEWIALRLFLAFVNNRTDRKWLEELQTGIVDDQAVQNCLVQDGLEDGGKPFRSLPPLAEVVGWLIVSHHRLPKWTDKAGEQSSPRLRGIDNWLTRKFDGSWNSPQCTQKKSGNAEFQQLWKFPAGLPTTSSQWQKRAKLVAKRALQRVELISGNKRWLADPFPSHLARLCLMLSDHIYSASNPTPRWQDSECKLLANTDRVTGEPKQKLDEHLTGVSHNSFILAKSLPTLSQTLPAITRHKGFTRRSADPKFRWQDKAYELACSIRERTERHGFFGINLASTGCGKTFANGKIMYGLANEKSGCRFNVALGLRTLTLQTGDALRTRLGLSEDDLAVMIGSQAVRQLHQYNNDAQRSSGSESENDLFEPGNYVHYEGALDDGRLSKWLRDNPRMHQLVSAPIVVSTIDYLISATEGDRGGRQIGPMLRLLTSDLVLDEPDDFDLSDLPAITRLVHWAGLLGSRILLSSATLPPSLVSALFSAYQAGRSSYQNNCGTPGTPISICCAWFDEYAASQSDHNDIETFRDAHDSFTQKRIKKLKKSQSLRRAEIVPVSSPGTSTGEAISALAETINSGIHELHKAHGISGKRGQKISVGLVRMANINPMVAVAKELLKMQPLPDHRLHFCIYHGQFPLIARSAIEQTLDRVLTRHAPDAIWSDPHIQWALKNFSENNQVFTVLATSVAEVGRDHDYDWAIAEPSSMRSIIQLAGRIQRHRKIPPSSENLLILSKNYRALTAQKVAFTKPGFESDNLKLVSHDLSDLLVPDQYTCISSIPRIGERNTSLAQQNLVDLEHAQLAAHLSGTATDQRAYASLWWEKFAHWCAQLQQLMPFRQSVPDIEYVFHVEDEIEQGKFHKIDQTGEMKLCDLEFKRIELDKHERVSLWGACDPSDALLDIASDLDMDLTLACRKFGSLRLKDQQWLFHPATGAHRTINDD